ncbi:MAG: seryl-tRNA synthetase [Rhodospirillaceae bacterium]|jgi:seryl-tRNA synthetase|nr:seryl-tRNA synthetase [Rhodospirillaceae bacterium]
MHDLKSIRDNPEAFDAGLMRRGLPPQAAEILELDQEHRRLLQSAEEMQARRNSLSKEIGRLKAKGEEAAATAAAAEVVRLKNSMPAAEKAAADTATALEALLARIPNLPAADVPAGADESANVELRRHGDPNQLPAGRLDRPRQHFDLGEALGQMDFAAAAKLAGARFVVLKGALARMERALAAFMLDLHTSEFGYTEIAPPYMVRDAALYGTGQLPKFAEDLFHVSGDYWLIPTAEVPLTNLVADTILEADQLPLRYTAYTPCFRSEAGAAGKDTRGMIRQHQFSKVELVSIVHPDRSVGEHERMTACAETVLRRLDLPFRTMVLSTGDMGFAATKTYDIEVWLPGQGRYREISSCSNCGDFQARRMKARFREAGAKGTRFVHTLNGSGLAVGRTLLAVLENYQQADGSIVIPDALRPYMGGRSAITIDD